MMNLQEAKSHIKFENQPLETMYQNNLTIDELKSFKRAYGIRVMFHQKMMMKRWYKLYDEPTIQWKVLDWVRPPPRERQERYDRDDDGNNSSAYRSEENSEDEGNDNNNNNDQQEYRTHRRKQQVLTQQQATNGTAGQSKGNNDMMMTIIAEDLYQRSWQSCHYAYIGKSKQDCVQFILHHFFTSRSSSSTGGSNSHDIIATRGGYISLHGHTYVLFINCLTEKEKVLNSIYPNEFYDNGEYFTYFIPNKAANRLLGNNVIIPTNTEPSLDTNTMSSSNRKYHLFLREKGQPYLYAGACLPAQVIQYDDKLVKITFRLSTTTTTTTLLQMKMVEKQQQQQQQQQ